MDEDRCDWCRAPQDPAQMTSVSMGTIQLYDHLCRACYYCWKHGPPPSELPESPLQDSIKALREFTDLTSAQQAERYFNPLGAT